MHTSEKGEKTTTFSLPQPPKNVIWDSRSSLQLKERRLFISSEKRIAGHCNCSFKGMNATEKQWKDGACEVGCLCGTAQLLDIGGDD